VKFFGWAIISFLVLFTANIILYYLLANSKIQEHFIKKTPVFSDIVKLDISEYDRKFSNIQNLALFSFGIIDYKIFVGNIYTDFKNDRITVEPLTKDLYEDLKALATSIDKNYKEEKTNNLVYGLKLPYYQIITNNYYIKLTPKLFITDLRNFDEDDLDYIKSRYFVFDEKNYKSYSFNVDLINKFQDYGGIILDKKIIDMPAVRTSIETLRSYGVEITEDLQVTRFKDE